MWRWDPRWLRLSPNLWWVYAHLALWKWNNKYSRHMYSSMWRPNHYWRWIMWRWQQRRHRHLLKLLHSQTLIHNPRPWKRHLFNHLNPLCPWFHLPSHNGYLPTRLPSLLWPILIHTGPLEGAFENKRPDWKSLKYLRALNSVAKHGPIFNTIFLVPKIRGHKIGACLDEW